MRATTALVSLLLAVLTGEALGATAKRSTAADLALHRWRRQAIHCQPGDIACAKCSGSCDAVEISHLPECCEAFNACCDHYFKACKQCSNFVSQDEYFPEYCCASFTDCCDLITTFTTEVKTPVTVRPKAKSKSDLLVPVTPAPRPDFFPGSAKSPEDEAPSAPEAPVAPVASAAIPQAPKRAPLASAPAPATPARGQVNRGRGQARGGRGRQPQRQATNAAERSGRVTARGRVL